MIDSKLQKELNNKFNPDGSQLRTYQLRLLDLLIYFDKVCRENGIRYWLSSGTLIGAIRHGGFIPWDDDVDVDMLRSDYLKLEKILLDLDDYDLQTHKTDFFYVRPFSKLRDKNSVIREHKDDHYKMKGLFIDVFQLEYIPSEKLCSFMANLNMIIDSIGAKADSKFDVLFFSLCKRLFFALRFVLRVVLFPFRGKRLRHTLGTGYGTKYRVFEELMPLSEIEFEGHSFFAPNNPDAYLKRIYGDYTQLPPMDTIRPHLSDYSLW